ncbi:MAG: hypothetical protein JXB49_09135 [Bacteroidales bacterium]|nr:hypothetical protein [Bacteroidales bacterium]
MNFSPGKLLDNKEITTTETSFTMSQLPPATYMLKVTDGNKEVKVFKIV